MSFHEQERLLFDLLFDREKRRSFCQDPDTAMASYQLEAAERADFHTIRPPALELDAKLRTDLILSRLCRHYPTGFSIFCALEGGRATLFDCINPELIRLQEAERASRLGRLLLARLDELPVERPEFRLFGKALVGAELGMNWTAANCRRHWDGEPAPDHAVRSVAENWIDLPIRSAAFVSACLIPMPYAEAKQRLCPEPADRLWHTLRKQAPKLDQAFANEDPRLLVTRASIEPGRTMQTGPRIRHRTMELSVGFASLFEHVDGTMSVRQMLSGMRQSGAPETVLSGVESGFLELLQAGMLSVGVTPS